MWDLSSLTRGHTCGPCVGRLILNHWIARELLGFFSTSLTSISGSPWSYGSNALQSPACEALWILILLLWFVSSIPMSSFTILTCMQFLGCAVFALKLSVFAPPSAQNTYLLPLLISLLLCSSSLGWMNFPTSLIVNLSQTVSSLWAEWTASQHHSSNSCSINIWYRNELTLYYSH